MKKTLETANIAELNNNNLPSFSDLEIFPIKNKKQLQQSQNEKKRRGRPPNKFKSRFKSNFKAKALSKQRRYQRRKDSADTIQEENTT